MDNLRCIVSNNNTKVTLYTSYFLNNYPEYRYHHSLYNLDFLYQYVENTCKLIIFQGVNDHMIDTTQKIKFSKKIKNTEIMIIDENDIDGIVFKNTSHGLGLDFFAFFRLLMPMLDNSFEMKAEIKLKEHVFVRNEFAYFELSYKTGLPELIHFSK